MSISANEGSEEWHEFEHNSIREFYRIEAADLGGQTATGGFVAYEEEVPISRGEMAELVHFSYEYGAELGATATAEGSVAFKPEVHLGTLRGAGSDPDDTLTPENVNVDRKIASVENDENALYRGRLIAESSFNDTASGTGGGADLGNNQYYERDYRNELEGRGPLAEAGDDIIFKNAIQVDNIDDHSVAYYSYARFVWDTFDAPDIPDVPQR